MKWLSQVVLDLLVTIAVAVYALTQNQILYYVIWGYTGLLLLSRILYYFISFLQQKASGTDAPQWFYHLVYGLVNIMLVISSSYYLLAAWVIIWILSSIPKK